MELITYLFQFFLTIDQHLAGFIQQYGALTYGLLFLIIFCETGLVIFPFLPGDSLLFAAGALAANAQHPLDPHLLVFLLTIAAVLGNMTNYAIGKAAGPKMFHSKKSWLFNPEHLTRAHAFYERYGNKTIIISRFIPIIRSVAPFVAGIGAMNYRQFFIYNVVGALLWVAGLIYLSYLFGNLPMVKENFSVVILAIIFISLLPPFIAFIHHKCCAKS